MITKKGLYKYTKQPSSAVKVPGSLQPVTFATGQIFPCVSAAFDSWRTVPDGGKSSYSNRFYKSGSFVARPAAGDLFPCSMVYLKKYPDVQASRTILIALEYRRIKAWGFEKVSL